MYFSIFLIVITNYINFFVLLELIQILTKGRDAPFQFVYKIYLYFCYNDVLMFTAAWIVL